MIIKNLAIIFFIFIALDAQAVRLSSWSAENAADVEILLKKPGKSRVAVFDADGTLWPGDIQEGFLQWLISNDKLTIASPKKTYERYERFCTSSKLRCYSYAVESMQGISEKNAQQWAKAYFTKHLASTIYPGVKELIAVLQAKGYTVWIVSASSQIAVESAAQALNISPKHIIGIRQKKKNGVLTGELLKPVTHREGKVLAIKKIIKKTPSIVIGNAMTDLEMLQFSNDLSIVINPSSEKLYSEALKADWIIQYWD